MKDVRQKPITPPAVFKIKSSTLKVLAIINPVTDSTSWRLSIKKLVKKTKTAAFFSEIFLHRTERYTPKGMSNKTLKM